MMQDEASRLSIQSEELFRLMAENVEDFAIFAVSLDGYAASWNPGVEKLLGYSELEWVGRNACDIFTPEDNERDACGLEMSIAREKGRAADQRMTVEQITEQGALIADLLENGYTLEQAKAQFASGLHPNDWQAISEAAASRLYDNRHVAKPSGAQPQNSHHDLGAVSPHESHKSNP